MACWHQVPASSLPADDLALAHHAGYGRDLKGWRKVKEQAMWGFVECADGRYYNFEIATHAKDAADKMKAARERTAAASQARWAHRGGASDGVRDGVRRGSGNGSQQNTTEENLREKDTTPPHSESRAKSESVLSSGAESIASQSEGTFGKVGTNKGPHAVRGSKEEVAEERKEIILAEFKAFHQKDPEQPEYPHNLSGVDEWPLHWSNEVIQDRTRYALTNGLARKEPVRSVDYIRKVIAGADKAPRVAKPIHWDGLVEMFIERGYWHGPGPPPGERGCEVPREVLERMGWLPPGGPRT
jgi:hypothetical protein